MLLQRPQLQIVVRPCVADGHSIWQFQDDGKKSYPKAVRVPPNPRGAIADRAFYAAPSLRHVEVATGIQHAGVLREVAAPGCIQHGPKGVCGVLLPRSSWGQS